MGAKSSSPLWDPCPFSKYKPRALRMDIANMQVQAAVIRPNMRLRLVVCGGGMDGKSSSINNILSALEGKYTQPANTGGITQHVTQQYVEYKMLVDDANDSNFLICEMPGLRDCLSEEQNEVQTEAIKASIMGKFQSGDVVDYPSLTAEALQGMETRQERATCVIFVVDGRKVKNKILETSTAFECMKSVLEFALINEIKTACLLVKCDEIDRDVKENVENIYYSKEVEDIRLTLQHIFMRFPGDRIFPIVNYTEDLVATTGMMVPSLFALKHIMSDILSNMKRRVQANRC